MQDDEVLFTPSGYEEMKQQLEEYKRKLHKEIPERIKEAKEHGGELRENKEYDDIKQEQAYLDGEVRRLESILERAVVMDESEINTSHVGIGSKVTLRDVEQKRTETFELVSSAEVNLEQNKISVTSPVGSALMGHHKGEEIAVETPSGKVRYKILAIQKG
ncbi:MAG: transcription elongation factor GreA [Candidatus Bipolaricaulia bacterium]